MTVLRSACLAPLYALLLAGACATQDAPPPPAEPVTPPPLASTVYEGAQVWTGSGFETRDLALLDGRIIQPFRADTSTQRIDVSGQYITPAIANAHQHITSATRDNSWAFFEIGVYYVWNPNLYYGVWSTEAPQFFARSDTIEHATSFGGITEPGSHPEPLYVDNLARYVYDDATYDDMFGSAFHYGRDAGEIEAALDTLVSQGADFVKIYLTGSETYSAPAADGSPTSDVGLNPDNIPALVTLAHARNLPVMAHVETRSDFRVAVDAGVDFLAHLPGYGGVSDDETGAKTLTDDDIAAAAESGISVIPTYALAAMRFEQALGREDIDEEARGELERRQSRSFEVQADNLSRLQDAGVPILLGTDLFPGGAHTEMRHWVEISAMTRTEAMQASFQTSETLFPDQGYGCLADGCAADFLLLSGNPAEDLSAFDTIQRRIKAGNLLQAPGPAGDETGDTDIIADG